MTHLKTAVGDYTVKAGLFTAEEVGAPHKRERLFILAYRNSDRCIGHTCTTTGENDPQGWAQCAACTVAGGNSAAAQQLPISETGFSPATAGQELQPPQTLLANPACAGKQPRVAGKLPPAECGSFGYLPRLAEPAGTAMVYTDDTGLEGRGRGQLPQPDRLPAWPPGPSDDEGWRAVPYRLKPAIHRMADGLANRVDSIRACGNGVVPLVAAYAWQTLTSQLRQAFP